MFFEDGLSLFVYIKFLTNLDPKLPAMLRHHVQSSNVCAIGYDPESRTMEIEFGKGGAGYELNRLYHYFDVTPEVHQALMTHWSPGRFVNRELKNDYVYLGTVQEVEP